MRRLRVCSVPLIVGIFWAAVAIGIVALVRVAT